MIRREDHGPVSILRLEHGKANALDVDFCRGLASALAELREGADAPAVVLTGTGRIFSAGVDLHRLIDGGADYIRTFLPALRQVFRDLFTHPRPVVAAINGHAIAGGAVLAAACDRAMMTPGTGRIGVPELLVGVPFPATALEIVRHAAGSRVAQDLAYSGRTLEVEEAIMVGLVDVATTSNSLMQSAIAEAQRLAQLPRETFLITKRQLQAPALAAIDAVERGYESRVTEAWCSEPVLAQIRAYVQNTVRKGKS